MKILKSWLSVLKTNVLNVNTHNLEMSKLHIKFLIQTDRIQFK